jgi:hypothetical protein
MPKADKVIRLVLSYADVSENEYWKLRKGYNIEERSESIVINLLAEYYDFYLKLGDIICYEETKNELYKEIIKRKVVLQE